MRLVLAALLTTVVPMLIGVRWVGGPIVVRLSLGSVVGLVVLCLGAIAGGLVGLLLPGAAFAALIGWWLGPRFRFVVDAPVRDPLLRRALVILLCLGCALLLMALFRPVPAWDGWMTWSLKAKALAHDGSFDGAVFRDPVYAYSHQDYPPLLPAWQSLAYLIAGDTTTSWPLQFQLAWLWTAGGIALLTLVSSGWGRGFLFGLAWLCAPTVVYWVMGGYADVPMALFLLLGLVVLLLAPRTGGSPAVAGLLLGACALTKNEGLVLALAATVAVLVWSRRRMLVACVAGVTAAAYAPWFIQLRLVGTTNDILNGENLHRQTLSGVLSRVGTLLSAWAGQVVSVRAWGLLLLAGVVSVLLGWRPRPDLTAAVLGGVAAVSLIYLVTPYVLRQQLTVSIDRVAIAPMGLLALLLATARPPAARSHGLSADGRREHVTASGEGRALTMRGTDAR